MPGPYKRKKYHNGDTHLKKSWRTKRRTKDLDQIDSDLQPDQLEKTLRSQEIDFEKPGLGLFNCIHCAHDFINEKAFQDHIKSKRHKRRLHALKTEPYTIEESERAAGMGSYIAPKKRKMETCLPPAIQNGLDIQEITKKPKMNEDQVDQDGDAGMKE